LYKTELVTQTNNELVVLVVCITLLVVCITLLFVVYINVAIMSTIP